jgi:protein-disulfide isomerase
VKRISFILGCLLLCSGSTSIEAQSSDELSWLRTEIRELRESQKAVQKELQEIKRLLQARPAIAADPLPNDPIDISREPAKGDATARIALIEYSDYQCPFCSRFGKDTYPRLETEYIKTGKLKYVFRDLPLNFHKQAFKAAEAAHCAGEQGKFWQMHDRLFSYQKNLSPEELPGHAEALRLDVAAFQQCLDSGRFAEDIRKDIADASKVGITGTPTFLLGTINRDGTVKVSRKLVGAQQYDAFRATLEGLLASAGGNAP